MSIGISYISTKIPEMYPQRYELPSELPSYLTIDQAIDQAPRIALEGSELKSYNMKQLFARGIAADLYHWVHPEKDNQDLRFQYSSTHVSDIFRWGYHLRTGLEGNNIRWNQPPAQTSLMDPQTYGLAYLVTLSTFAKEEKRDISIQNMHQRFQDTLYWKFVELVPQTRYQIEQEAKNTVTKLPQKKAANDSIREAEQKIA